jgi:para-nitrobenzyl esterase
MSRSTYSRPLRSATAARCMLALLLVSGTACDEETVDAEEEDASTVSESKKEESVEKESADKESTDKDSEEKADAPAADKALSATVKTANGPIKGEKLEVDGKSVHIFRGVRYAAAPTGDLRWKPPQPLEPWTETQDAIEWGDRAPQGESTSGDEDALGGMSEDCLNLNVLSPAKQTSEKLPVMVFFHGGGLSILSGNSTTYCNTALPLKGNVVVTVNHRLGPFGYFSHPELAKESEHDSSGNYGTLDLIESLKWIKKNIAAFGGDPDNVTIFGESGGGSKVLSCMASPLGKGLFHRAIVESGSRSSTPEGTTKRDAAEQAGERVAEKLGAASLEELRGKSWKEVLEASAVEDVRYAANLSIDGWVLPKSVHDTFQAGEQSDVPLIVGANEGEVSELTEVVPNLGKSHGSVSSKAYIYVFSHLPPAWRDNGCIAFHGVELPYVFGNLDGLTSPTIVFLQVRGGCAAGDPKVDDLDREVSDRTMRIWSQFAKTGNPSVKDLIDWPAFDKDNDKYLDIGQELEVKEGVSKSGVAPPMAAMP